MKMKMTKSIVLVLSCLGLCNCMISSLTGSPKEACLEYAEASYDKMVSCSDDKASIEEQSRKIKNVCENISPLTKKESVYECITDVESMSCDKIYTGFKCEAIETY